jgi:cytochrome c oxidase accessory protein FixG
VDKQAAGLGDCIDCYACVHVCPVGIDIRDGLQYECVACGACVDACDDMMQRVGYEPGLVRYTTEHALNGNKTRLLRPRLIGYFAALLVMFAAFIWAIGDRVPLEMDVIRDRGQLYTTTPAGLIENVFTLKVANKGQTDQSYRILIEGPDGLEMISSAEINVKAGELLTYPVRLQIEPSGLQQANTPFSFHIEAIDNPSIRIETESRFLGPSPQR